MTGLGLYTSFINLLNLQISPRLDDGIELCKKTSLFLEMTTKAFSGEITCFIYFAKEMP